jgi:hypothetical protein
MTDSNNPNAEPMSRQLHLGRWINAIVSAVVGVSVFWVFYSKVPDGAGMWHLLGVGAAALIFAAIAVAIARMALAPLTQGSAPFAPTHDQAAAMRSRIAPVILAIGTAGIAALALGMMVAFAVVGLKGGAQGQELIKSLDTLLMGVFSSVLPVFATWVGTVIAFYFTESAYNTASQTMRARGDADAGKPQVSSIMKDYKSINKIGVDARPKADETTVDELKELFEGDKTIGYIFEEPKRNPIYVIKKELFDKISGTPTNTVKEYRAISADVAGDVKRMLFVKATETLPQLKDLFTKDENANIQDAFVTMNGQPSEEVLGWIRRGTF